MKGVVLAGVNSSISEGFLSLCREQSQSIRGLIETLARPWTKIASLWLIFSCEALALAALSIPHALSLDLWLFGDQGAILPMYHLIEKGYSPGVDFSFPYGLLPLLIGHGWLSVSSFTPAACWCFMVATSLLVALGMARFAVALELGRRSVVFMALTLPFSILAVYVHFPHVLEAAAITNGLAEQARGRRDLALAYATTAVLCKPSMGYFFGLVLIGLMVAEVFAHRSEAQDFAPKLVPASAIGLVMTVVLGLAYGTRSVFNTLLPIVGMRTYKAQHFGFFLGDGRNFWHPAGARLTYYLGSEAGFWIAATLILLIGAIISGAWLFQSGEPRSLRARRAEMVLTCAILHCSFVLFFFGSRGTWSYYSYLMVMGLAVLSCTWERGPAFVIVALGFLSVLGLKTRATAIWNDWQHTTPSEETAGLWASQAERSEWNKVLGYIAEHGNDAILLSTEGSAPLLFPGFLEPTSGYLFPGEALEDEIQRAANRFSEARLVIVAKSQRDYGLPSYWPLVENQWTGVFEVWSGDLFQIYVKQTSVVRASTPAVRVRNQTVIERARESTWSSCRPAFTGANEGEDFALADHFRR